jgi:hypothetical protein
MKFIVFLTGVMLAIGTQATVAQPANCPRQPDQTVYIRKGVNDNASALIDAINQAKANTWVLLEPDVEINFSSEDSRFIFFDAPCVTLASYLPQPVTFSPAPRDLPAGDGALPEPGSGRTPHSLGPALTYNPGTPNGDAHLIDIDCTGNPGHADGARILGIRVVGPKDEDLEHNIKGIFINKCQDVEIANNEIHGWGAAITVLDTGRPIPDSFPETWFDQIFIKIHDNYIHHNQDGESGGYGVDVQHSAFADIVHNVFDFNKHSITAAGDSGGYRALGNLIPDLDSSGGFVG